MRRSCLQQNILPKQGFVDAQRLYTTRRLHIQRELKLTLRNEPCIPRPRYRLTGCSTIPPTIASAVAVAPAAEAYPLSTIPQLPEVFWRLLPQNRQSQELRTQTALQLWS